MPFWKTILGELLTHRIRTVPPTFPGGCSVQSAHLGSLLAALCSLAAFQEKPAPAEPWQLHNLRGRAGKGLAFLVLSWYPVKWKAFLHSADGVNENHLETI